MALKFEFNKSGQALLLLKDMAIKSTTVPTKTGLFIPSRTRGTKWIDKRILSI